nr:cytochrome c1 [Paracoccus jeotgali]
MSLRMKTLTAVAALSLGAAAWAQDEAVVIPLPTDTATESSPVEIVTEPATAPVASEPPAAQPASEVIPPDGADEADAEAAADEAAVEPEAEAEAEAVADEAPAEEAAAEEPAAEEATDAAAEEPAAEDATDATEAVEAADEATTDDAEDLESLEQPGLADSGETEMVIEEPPIEVEEAHVTDIAYSFEGPFGTFDQFQLQRGLQVFTEVCASCHGLKQVAFRTLADEGGPNLPVDQVRAYAAQFDIYDPETDEDRPRILTDHFPTVEGLGMGPDLSLMAKARAGFHGPLGTGISQLFNGIGGPEYIYSVLMHYTGEDKEQAGTVLYHNTTFPGNWISMPPPLFDDLVEYEDGTPATMDQMAKDVSAFLMWTAEPHMMARKKVGFVSVIFLTIFAALLYLTNKRLWYPIKHRRPE